MMRADRKWRIIVNFSSLGSFWCCQTRSTKQFCVLWDATVAKLTRLMHLLPVSCQASHSLSMCLDAANSSPCWWCHELWTPACSNLRMRVQCRRHASRASSCGSSQMWSAKVLWVSTIKYSTKACSNSTNPGPTWPQTMICSEKLGSDLCRMEWWASEIYGQKHSHGERSSNYLALASPYHNIVRGVI